MCKLFKKKIHNISILTLFIFNFILNIAYTSYSDNENIFEDVYRQALAEKDTDLQSIETYLKEMKIVYEKKNISVDSSISHVWVLSGRGSYSTHSVDESGVKDLEDDYNRIELGIKIARKATETSTGKQNLTEEDFKKYGPTIVYNGCPQQNADLKKALETGTSTYYPAEKFRIFELDPQDVNTRGQFVSFKKEMPVHNSSIAVITHAYHFPRVARMIESKLSPFNSQSNISFYLVDRKLKAPDSINDMVGEIKRIPKYIEQNDLTKDIPPTLKF